jgi:outer membrane protein assembly factor BamA
VSREPGGLLAGGSVYGASGYDALGLGASATWDSRDSQFFPRRGTYVEAWYGYYPGPLGDHRGFGRGAVDASHFATLTGDHVLGLDGSVALAQGSPPFTLLPSLGGVRPIRGYADGRYRDHFSYGLQAEYRFPIAWRLRGVAFAGVGDVASAPTSLALRTARAAAGCGLRFRLTDDGVHLRADVASNGGSPDLYLIVLEAF